MVRSIGYKTELAGSSATQIVPLLEFFNFFIIYKHKFHLGGLKIISNSYSLNVLTYRFYFQ